MTSPANSGLKQTRISLCSTRVAWPCYVGRTNHVEAFDALIGEFSSRKRLASDGVPLESLEEAEARLGCRLPTSLHTMLLRIGRWDVLRIHNVMRDPANLEVCDGRIVFMDENQDVVSWAVPQGPGDSAVWQRNNKEDAWYSEELDLLDFLRSMLAWYRDQSVFPSE